MHGSAEKRNRDEDLPQDLQDEVGKLHEMFWVSGEKLKEITTRFEEELDEGLQEHGRNIAMFVTWVQGFPTGKETGSCLTVDLGGTNLRVCWIVLKPEKGDTEVTQTEYRLPDKLKTGTAKELWDFIVDSLDTFIQKHKLNGSKEKPLDLGFTFSYPAIQDHIDHGILQTWTKGFDIEGVEGNDVAAQLRNAMSKRDLPIRLVAIVNDTTGAMMASAYNDPETIIGAIFGTGCNAAYMDSVGGIPKLKSDMSSDTPMAINCEYGAFDNARRVLPLTKYDKQIDAESPRPGEQAFEKMSAGLYLGEIFRLVALDVHTRGLVFKRQDVTRLEEAYRLDTGFLSAIENDESEQLTDAAKQFKDHLAIEAGIDELRFLQRVAEMIAVRGARMCTCGVAAICHRKDLTQGHVAADGAVANKHPKFKHRWASALGEILDWPADRDHDPITLTSAEDGSGIGAAVITAMTIAQTRDSNQHGH